MKPPEYHPAVFFLPFTPLLTFAFIPINILLTLILKYTTFNHHQHYIFNRRLL